MRDLVIGGGFSYLPMESFYAKLSNPTLLPGLYISDVKILFGTLEQVKQQNPHLFKRPAASVYYEMITRKLGFPAVINPSKSWTNL